MTYTGYMKIENVEKVAKWKDINTQWKNVQKDSRVGGLVRVDLCMSKITSRQ